MRGSLFRRSIQKNWLSFLLTRIVVHGPFSLSYCSDVILSWRHPIMALFLNDVILWWRHPVMAYFFYDVILLAVILPNVILLCRHYTIAPSCSHKYGPLGWQVRQLQRWRGLMTHSLKWSFISSCLIITALLLHVAGSGATRNFFRICSRMPAVIRTAILNRPFATSQPSPSWIAPSSHSSHRHLELPFHHIPSIAILNCPLITFQSSPSWIALSSHSSRRHQELQ